MLQFFRRYQKFFFLFITIVIVISFVFFGTYQAFAPTKGEKTDERSYTTQMIDFLDTEQWMVGRHPLSTNFLNDGVVSQEFLETGMGALLAAKYGDKWASEWQLLHEKEKAYTPYRHPSLPGLGAESVWSIFAPEMPTLFEAVRADGTSFKERCDLFLAQKAFPPHFLSQVIRYQEQSNPHFPPDPRLAKEDSALFGYQTLSDWFGKSFMESVTETVIEMARLARKQGFKVTKEELLADLVSRSQEVVRMMKQQLGHFPVEDGYALFQLYLRQQGTSEATALKIWEDVTLFRRMIHEVGDAALVDAFPLSQFYRYAYENATVELYQMAKELRLQTQDDLKRFETYLAAVANATGELPTHYAPVSLIQERAPELVGKRYRLYMAHVSKKRLQAKVPFKEMLEWECELANWEKLKNQFPELAQKEGTPFEVLEGLDGKLKKLVDGFARKQIVETHPEWVEEALAQAEMEEKSLFLTTASASPWEGITSNEALMAQLDKEEEVSGYTQDNTTYFRFLVRERSAKPEILTYKEALKEKDLLDTLSQRFQGEALAKSYTDSLPAEQQATAPARRFAAYLERYKEKLPEGELPEEELPPGDLAAQFAIEKIEKTVTRAEKSFLSAQTLLALEEGSWSSVEVAPGEGAYLYKVVSKGCNVTAPTEKRLECEELLSKEARCRFFEKFLSER